MKLGIGSLLIIFCFIISSGYSQTSELNYTFYQDFEYLKEESKPLKLLVEDIRRAVYSSESILEDCLPSFASAKITLEGSYEKEKGIDLNLVFFKINTKKKKNRSTISSITFVKDTILKPFLEVPREASRRNFDLIRRLILLQAYSNCEGAKEFYEDLQCRAKESEQENVQIGHEVFNVGELANEAIQSNAFKTQKIEIVIKFIVEKELGANGEFIISPISGSLGGKLKRKNIQTVIVVFGKDP